jgi:hypothetical protein
MRSLLALSVSAVVLLGMSLPADAAKSHRRSVQNFHRANAAIVAPDPLPAPVYRYYPGYNQIPPEQNRNLDPSNWGGG